MRLRWILVGLMWAQSWNHPTTGQQNTYSGGCQVHTCSGNYYDNGGPTGNYANNVNWIYWTFCPNNSTQCLRVTFSSFNVESGCGYCSFNPCCYDILLIQNGPAQNGPILWQGCGTSSPGTFTSSDPSGCLTFRFCSDGSVTRSGWAASFSCVTCSGRQPAANSDCQSATPICSSNSFTDYSYGPGATPQCGGCITNENYTNFYIFQPQGTSGNILLSICPTNGTDDYDFAIWGPFSTNNLSTLCGSLGTPVRCSYAMYPRSFGCGATVSCTGLYSGANDVSEDVCGDGRVRPLYVTAGSYYILMVNGWTAGAQGYQLTWTLPGGMSLNCTPLSQPITRFSAQPMQGRGVFLSWDVDPARLPHGVRLVGYGIERSVDEGKTWVTIGQVPAELTSFTDPAPVLGTNGYRLRYQYEDGSHEVYIKPAWIEWQSEYGTPFRAWWRSDLEALHVEIFDHGLGRQLEVYTVDGRLIKTVPFEPTPFLSSVGIPDLAAGTYLVRYNGLTQAVAVPARP